jgi:hypothetical protein
VIRDTLLDKETKKEFIEHEEGQNKLKVKNQHKLEME